MINYQNLKGNFESHGFTTSYFETKNDAAEYMKKSIKNTKVAFGGSVTIEEMGLYDLLSENNDVIWHWIEPGKDTLAKAKEAEVYICSANGISETGEVVNIDGTGNRVSMNAYGPQKIYFIVGKNKIEPDLEKAIYRAKNIAAPKNAQRLKKKTPCAVCADKCYNCNSPERICHTTLIIDRPSNNIITEIVFVNEELGY